MLEIILVWVASKKIAAMAEYKSYSPAVRAGFVIMFIVLWFGGEIMGAVFGTIMTRGREDNFWKVYFAALAGAGIGAGVGFTIVAILPDQGRLRKKRRRRRRVDDDDGYEEEGRRPRRRRADVADDYEDEDRPRRKRRREDEDDYEDEDRPRRRPARSEDEEVADESPPKNQQVREGPPAARDTRLVQCSSCQRSLKIPATLIGKKVKCPACKEVFVA
jgi:hypothetical protein